MLGGKGPCQTERWLFRPQRALSCRQRAFQTNTSLSQVNRFALWRHEGTLVGQKRHLSGGLRDSHKLKVGILGPKEDPLRPKIFPFRPAKAPRKLAKGFPCQNKALTGQRRALLDRKGAFVCLKGPSASLKWHFSSQLRNLLGRKRDN